MDDKNNLSYAILKDLGSKVLGQTMLHLFQSNKAFKLNRLLGRKIFLPFCFLSPRPVDPVAGPSFNFCGKTRKRPRKRFSGAFLELPLELEEAREAFPVFLFFSRLWNGSERLGTGG